MKNVARLTLAMSLLWMTLLVQADPDAAAKYQSCAVCHGEGGQGNIELGAPALAGQGAQYLERQLQYFKSGVRGADPRDTQGLQMQMMAGTLADEDIPAIAAYLSGLPQAVPAGVPKGDLKNGNNYYQSKCGACHGGQAQGNSGLNSPALAILNGIYLKQQFQSFQQGLRGTHPDDKYGRQMKMMSTSLPTDQDLDDVIAYIQSMAKPL